MNGLGANNVFIHIGKTGGTTVLKYLNRRAYGHPKTQVNENDNIIIWLRNPIKRLVSAFYFAKYIINFDCSRIDNINDINIENNIAPERISQKCSNGSKYIFSERFDCLIDRFENANEFLESLNSEDPDKRRDSMELINYCDGISGYDYVGVFKGYNYHFDNGDFIDKYWGQIVYVGTMENMDNDLNRLAEILNTDTKDKNIPHFRKNSYDAVLSSLAIRNICGVFENTEFKCIKKLLELNLISKEICEQYINYSI